MTITPTICRLKQQGQTFMIEFKTEQILFYSKKHLMNSHYITLFIPKCVHRISDHLLGMLVFLLLPFFLAEDSPRITVVWRAKLRLQCERGNNSQMTYQTVLSSATVYFIFFLILYILFRRFQNLQNDFYYYLFVI